MNKMTMIFANPRSGSTLLMRLLNKACLTRCIGDRNKEFFEAVCDLWENKTGKNTSYRPSLYDGSFPDEFSGYEDEAHLEKEYLNIIKNLLFTFPWSHGSMKSTVPGFNNTLIPRLAPIIDLFRDSHEFTLVVLKRPAEEIAESFITTPDGPLFEREDKRQAIIDTVGTQNEEFKKIMDFDTIQMTYEQLCREPEQCIEWCNPIYKLSPNVVADEMAKKIR